MVDERLGVSDSSRIGQADDRAYVVVEVYKIARDYVALKKRSAKLRQTRRKIADAEGYELQGDAEKGNDASVGDAEVDALKNDWENWALNAAVYA